jgi:DNA recombination protein RmuC
MIILTVVLAVAVLFSTFMWVRAREQMLLLQKDLGGMTNHFKALSVEVLEQTSKSFLELASLKFDKLQEKSQGDLILRQKAIDEVIRPIKTSLDQVDKKIAELDKGYTGSYLRLIDQMKGVGIACAELNKETASLSRSLRAPHVRGRWGEIQLKRVVELAGMLANCDFYEQQSGDVDEKRLRPDLIVRLPSQRHIVVDAKTPIFAYLEAMEALDEQTRIARLKDHARHIKGHIAKLSSKSYWEQFPFAPEFVVLFIPGESFFSAALEQDPSLIEAGAEQKVILATPTTLIALLRSVEYGWRHEALAENSKAIAELGKDLYARLAKMKDHFDAMRKGLEGAVDGYNKAIGTYETRVMVSARKFKELEATTGADLEVFEQIEKVPRKIHEAVESTL